MQSALSVGVVRHSSTAAIRCADWTADTTSGSNTRGVTEHSGGYFFFSLTLVHKLVLAAEWLVLLPVTTLKICRCVALQN